MINLRAQKLEGDSFSKDLFGANILGYRDKVGPDGTYDDVIHALNVPHVRYPGGSFTEYHFDITNPNATTVTHSETGQTRSMLPYDEFMGWAEKDGIAVTVVIPTRDQMSDRKDSNGDRYPDINEQEVRTFVKETLDGKYGSPEIRSFEVGNEYWGSGDMTSVEYGRFASEMALIIKDEIKNHPDYQSHFKDVDVAVQVGYNYGHARLSDDYSHLNSPQEQIEAVRKDYNIGDEHDIAFGSGRPNWTKIANILVEREFDAEETKAVDALVLHNYGKGLDNPNSWYFGYDVTNQVWDKDFDHATRYVTEWNSKTVSYSDAWKEEYGLLNAHEMLNIAEAMVINKVESAHVWAVQQNTATDLANDEGTTDLTVAGEMFKMMSESLPGTRRVDLAGSSRRESEVEEEDSSVHVFAGEDGKMVIFVASTSEKGSDTAINVSNLVTDPGDVKIDVLGVEDGENPTANDADAEVRRLQEEDLMAGGQISVKLAAYEIMRIEMQDARFTQALQKLIKLNPDPGNPHVGYKMSVPSSNEDPDASSGKFDGVSGEKNGDDSEERDGEEGSRGRSRKSKNDEDESALDMTCFVATVAYADPWHPEVKWLRRFRDGTLIHYKSGRAFIDIYWKIGPIMARSLRNRPIAAQGFKIVISGIVKALQTLGVRA
jgi:hypothetical protein